MKIISLNREKTLDERNLALNVDEDLTNDVMDLVSYGTLYLRGQGRVLHVTIPGDDDEDFSHGFDQDNVATLQGKLNAAVEKLRKEEARKAALLQHIASQLGLALD